MRVCGGQYITSRHPFWIAAFVAVKKRGVYIFYHSSWIQVKKKEVRPLGLTSLVNIIQKSE